MCIHTDYIGLLNKKLLVLNQQHSQIKSNPARVLGALTIDILSHSVL